MKKISLKAKIDVAFVIIAIVFCVLIYSTYNRGSQVAQNRRIISETYATNTVLEKILSSTIDLETGTRGYTITGQPSFLKVFEEGNKDLEVYIDSLEELKGENPHDVARIKEIERLIDSKKNITQLTLDLRRDQGMEPAAALIATGKGKAIMDSIRVSIDTYQRVQVAQLNAKLSEIDENVFARNVNFFAFAIMAFFFVIVGYLRIRRNAKKLMHDEIIQRRLGNELLLQNQQLNEFTNITSHNLRSSTANIGSLIEIIDEKSTLDDFKMVFEMLKKVSKNLNDTLNELIEVLKIKKSALSEKEILKFEDICNKVAETLQGDTLKNNVKISCDFSEAPTVSFSKIYLESIVQNLVSNAIKYRHPERDPEIKIYSELRQGHVELHVQDNGLGIDLGRHGHKIFGMYQMFHTHPEAKGIGLFIIKTQIENLGGKISVHSDGHSGSTFSVTFGK